MAQKRSQTEGPGEQMSGMFKPDGAEKLPTKHYSQDAVKGGKKTTIEGPACAAGVDHGYTK